jgi:malate synthase
MLTGADHEGMEPVMTQRGLTLMAPTDAALVAAQDEVLSAGALALVGALARAFTPRLYELLRTRQARQKRFDAGSEKLRFLEETAHVRAGEWRVRAIPQDLLDRRVEITGPVDAKMIINALNSGAQVFMADFEDSNAPTWRNLILGQHNLMRAVRGTLTFASDAGKQYKLNKETAVLMARPRGLHLPERHLLVDGTAVPGALFDAALYCFHNAHALIAKGSGPYLYLPKLESHKEAKLWADALDMIEDHLSLPRGTIRCTVLIETLPAAFEMDEILYVLRDHIVGLNCGRWDYIFSTIKRRRREPGFVLPDRSAITMEQKFLRSYTQLLVKTCHKRGAFAMGGMSAFIPRKDDVAANDKAMEKVRADKTREVTDGHDGTWVAHPGLVQIAREVFDAHLDGRVNNLDVMREDVNVTAEDLLAVPEGARTEKGLRTNARVGVQYLAAWLDGLGCVPLDFLMEDAATAEISRAQIWQWLHAGVDVEGTPLTRERVRAVIHEETANLPGVERARDLFLELCLNAELEEFLTLPAYELLFVGEAKAA